MLLATPLRLINSQSITNCMAKGKKKKNKPRRHLLQSGMVISQCKWEDNNCLLKRRISSLAPAPSSSFFFAKQWVGFGSSWDSLTLGASQQRNTEKRQLKLRSIDSGVAGWREEKTVRAEGRQAWIKKQQRLSPVSVRSAGVCQLWDHNLRWQVKATNSQFT